MHGRSSRHGNQKEKLRAHIVNHQHKTEGTKQKQDEALNSQSPHPVTYFLQQNVHPNSTINQINYWNFSFKSPYSLPWPQQSHSYIIRQNAFYPTLKIPIVFQSCNPYCWFSTTSGINKSPGSQGIPVREGIFLIGSFEVG